MISSYFDELCEPNFKRYKNIIDINIAALKKKGKRTIDHFDNVSDVYIEHSYLITHMSMLHDLQTDKVWYKKPTTCG